MHVRAIKSRIFAADNTRVIQELKLVRAGRRADTASLRFERRLDDRAPHSGAAMAAFFDDDGALSLTRVDLVDASRRGLGLRCPVAVEPGVRFSLYSADLPLPHTTGTVAGCIPDGDAFRIGLYCDHRVAA